MYYIIDLINNYTLKFSDQKAVCFWWIRTNGRNNFSDLNVTGHDTVTRKEMCGSTWYAGLGYVPNYRHTSYLRRYQVLDDQFRSIDIRRWPEEVWEMPKYGYSWSIFSSGSKNHTHRVSGPSGHRRNLRDKANTEYSRDEAKEIYVIRDKSDVRNKTVMRSGDAWDYYEYAHAKHWTSSKCWKDQFKNPKQYAKHKSFHRAGKATSESTEDLVARLNAELCPA